MCAFERWILLELQVMNSPFNQEQVELLNRLLPTLTESQRTWLSGFIAALQGTEAAAAVAAAPQANTLAAVSAPVATATKEVTVLYGSQTGNGHGLSKKLSKKLEEVGLQVTMSSMSDFKPNNLKKLQNLLIIVSTHGEGEPPDNAIPFYEFLHSKRAPQVDHLQYSVLALGIPRMNFSAKRVKISTNGSRNWAVSGWRQESIAM